MNHPLSFRLYQAPLVLTVPGVDNSGAGHWQTIWETQRNDFHRAQLGMWEQPDRGTWVTRLDQAIRQIDAPVVLCAHSLGCLAVAWWAAQGGRALSHPVAGAMLVAPPNCDDLPEHDRLSSFGPTPRGALPFPAMVVASRNDPFSSIDWSHALARDWQSGFVDVGELGHINAQSDLGDWPDGRQLLGQLLFMAELSKSNPLSADMPFEGDESCSIHQQGAGI